MDLDQLLLAGAGPGLGYHGLRELLIRHVAVPSIAEWIEQVHASERLIPEARRRGTSRPAPARGRRAHGPLSASVVDAARGTICAQLLDGSALGLTDCDD